MRRIRVLPRRRDGSGQYQMLPAAPFRDPSRQLSIIVPALNDSACIVPTLLTLQPLRAEGHEVILVDGGSSDDTVELARELVDQVIEGAPGRTRQMNLGALHAWGETLLFLRPGSLLPDSADRQIFSALEGGEWGCFNVRPAGNGPLLRMMGIFASWSVRIAGIPAGEHGLFLRRELYERLGGFPEQPSAEGPSIGSCLRQAGRPVFPRGVLLTTGQRSPESASGTVVSSRR